MEGSLPLSQHSFTVPAFSVPGVVDVSSEAPFFVISDAASLSFQLMPNTVLDQAGATSLIQSLTIDSTSTRIILI